MRNIHAHTAILCLAMATPLTAKDIPSVAIAATETTSAPAPKDPVIEAKMKEQEALAAENKLAAERLTKATNEMRAEVTRLKLERELATEKLAMESTKRQAALQEELSKMQAEKLKLTEEGELSKIKADKLSNDLKAAQTESALELTRLQSEISRIETAEKRSKFADAKPVFLKDPAA